MKQDYKFLNSINFPSDLRRLSENDLQKVSDEVRNETIASIERIVRGAAISAGLSEDYYPLVEIKDEYTPAVFNNPSLVEKVQKSFSIFYRLYL